MKIQFSIWACLVLFVLNTAKAETEINNISNPSDVEKTADNVATTKTKEVVELLPGRSLQLVVNNNRETLEVNLSGETENLEWVIFQPKGKVISRISTTSKINEIKINNLSSGKYVLMIKDTKNRTLFKAFTLN